MERLQKVIAQAGIASRRKAEKLIEDGRVQVNDKTVVELGTKVRPGKDKVTVDGVPLDREAPVYYLFYKPRKVLSAANDDRGRTTVVDYFPEVKERIFPVGRLDYETSGLMILTNDGEFANELMHPKNRVPKTYIAKVKGKPSPQQLKQLERGIELEDGKTAPAKVKFKTGDKKKDTSIIEVVMHEGKNRQVRRMFEAIDHEIVKLKREQYAFLTLDGLNAGESRPLKPIEVQQLRESAVTKPSKKS
ncbi:ribosomal large subunit pseudouridine synthase B [Salsuginibacillus halophilus]|uniref:Pseudouridine synthase n=1 Tax=Salsuginibacillus halophilus TaxID=517424 RepID=A0A2P8HW29_9BACI|nr:pseudouridine synthase [Salsuginibacillus halophilus]PSL50442.1 ribosomal large subunit pseudouridine synthase B [Salsuginibacillus halophilus]